MSNHQRIYMDFDGVINALDPSTLYGFHTDTVTVDDAIIPRICIDTLRSLHGSGIEIIWISHREDDVYFYTDQLGLPRHPHLTFTDPTGSKVKDIIAYQQAHPELKSVIWEDSLTQQEIEALNDAGICVDLHCNTRTTSILCV